MNWSDPDAEPIGDIVKYAKSFSVPPHYYENFVRHPQPATPVASGWYYNKEQTKPDEVPDHLCVTPPHCSCDTQLCLCITPDPGQSVESYMSELATEVSLRSGSSTDEIFAAMQAFSAAVIQVAEQVQRGLSEWWASLSNYLPEPDEPPRHGPPLTMTFPPIRPMTSVHIPGPHAGASRTRHRTP